jgi:hypothetical protein
MKPFAKRLISLQTIRKWAKIRPSVTTERIDKSTINVQMFDPAQVDSFTLMCDMYDIEYKLL